MRKFCILITLLLVSFAITVHSSSAPHELGVCMTDSLSGKERKNLARWVFFAMAEHPEISSYANVSEADKDMASQYIGKVITRLLTEDCPRQATAALQENGSLAFEQAFGLVGQVAMQELMNDYNVNNYFSGFEKYLDEDKLKRLAE